MIAPGRRSNWIFPAILLAVLMGMPREASGHTERNHAIGSSGGNDDSSGKKDASATAPGDSDPSVDETLFLEIEVNGHPIGKIGEFIRRHGQLMIRPRELSDLGFRVPVPSTQENRLIALSDLPGLTWTLDMQSQTLRVTTGENYLLPTILRPTAEQSYEDRRVVASGTGATLNYDFTDTFSNSHNGISAGLDMRAFSPAGVVSSSWLVYSGKTSTTSGSDAAIRLDSTYSFADVNSMRRYSLGDFISSGLSWTRPVRLLGVQIRSDFSTRPDLVTFPLPSLAGSVAVPSTVDVLADGNLVMSDHVPPGPFQAPQVPVMSGAGTIAMSVTNALGQQVTVSQPFYASNGLLAPGLQTFSAQAGLVRLNWGSVSDEYGKIAAIGNYRRGLSPKFTLEADMEGAPGAVLAGAGGVQQISTLGELDYAAQGSFGSGHPGGLVALAAQRIGRKLSFGASAMIANRSFRDVASLNGDGVVRKQLSGFVSLSLRHIGTGGIAYAGIDEDPSPKPFPFSQSGGVHSHVFSGNYSRQLCRSISLFANGFRNFDSARSSGLQIGLTLQTVRRSSATVSWTSDGNAQLQAQQSAAQVHESGYQLYLSGPHTQHEFGLVQYKSPVGLFTGGIDSNAGETTGRLEVQSALSFVDHGFFPSNTIFDSFAIVDTKPLSHVSVLQENRNVGKTDASGRLLVPDMRSFEINHISIEPTQIPADVHVDTVAREIRPQDRSGAVVQFAIQLSHGALIRLVDGAGNPIPVGSSAKLATTNVAVPVGYEGEIYMEDLGLRNTVTVDLPDGGHCAVAFEYHAEPGAIPAIGPLACVEQKP